MTKKQEQEREDKRIKALALLRNMIQAGDTVYTVLKHVSSSGMSRRISVLLAHTDNVFRNQAVYNVDYAVADLLGYKVSHKGGLVVGGCGMDMGYSVAYSLSSALFPDGHDCIGENCPSNDHFNGDKREHHPSGGYALRHAWL